MKRTWRFWLALWAGKISATILRIVGRRGTTFPGVVAQRLDPECIGHLSHSFSEGIVIVTGTNGKTTTANLLASILRAAGRGFAFNQAGANLVTGITGALMEHVTWWGQAQVPLALLEVDEATVPKLCEQVSPKLAIVTNFFRDQLDRYGELDTTVRLVRDALTEETMLILNADDPLVAQFGQGRRNTLYYGVDRLPESSTESRETREARFCPQCGAALSYSLFHYGQLGLYACSHCSFTRPQPQVLAAQARMEEGKLKFRVGVSAYEVGFQGFYNLYNALAALAAAIELDVRGEDLEKGLREFVPQAGRMERFLLSEGPVTLALVKNPTGFNQVLRTVLRSEGELRLLIAINDLAADGRDISWLWDVDFEYLSLGLHRDQSHGGCAEIKLIVCSGLRAEDMALRLKYAGMPEEKLLIEHSLEKAVAALQAGRQGKERVFVLPTYTMLFPLRDYLASLDLDEGSQGKPSERLRKGRASA